MNERAYSNLGYAAGILIGSVAVCIAILAALGPDIEEPPIDVVKPIRLPIPRLVRTVP
jgi:hypothetical protein